MIITLTRTDSTNPDFISLVKLLDAELAVRDGDEHAFYSQFNKIAKLNHVVVAFAGEKAVSCGALRELDPATMEVKRMYTLTEWRGKGIAKLVLEELEKWTAELNYEKCRLETGIRQPEAIALYKKSGYRQIPNYGQYQSVENSVCFEKAIGIDF